MCMCYLGFSYFLTNPPQSITLRPRTHHPLQFALNPDNPFAPNPIVTLQNLLEQYPDCVEMASWTDTVIVTPPPSSRRSCGCPTHLLVKPALCSREPQPPDGPWTIAHLSHAAFSPPLPTGIALSPDCLGTECFRVETILSHTFSHSYGYVCSFIYYLI